MRLPRVNRRIFFALFILFFALISVQCIFVVGAPARAESTAYGELIADYHSFRAPTRVALSGEKIAVFDQGTVVIFDGAKRTVFESGADSCVKLCLSEAGVCLLVSEDEETSPEILSFSLDGAKRDVLFPSDGVTDIALVGDTLYTLASVTDVKGYRFSDAVQTTAFSLPVNPKRFSVSFAIDGENFYFLSISQTIFVKTSEGLGAGEEVSALSDRLCAADNKAYYLNKDGNVAICGQEKPLLRHGAGDATYEIAEDFAVGGGKIAVADAKNAAIKIFNAADGAFVKMIGSYGKDLKRLKDPVAISVKDGRIAVADASRVSVFTESGVFSLNGRSLSEPSDVVIAGDKYYVVANGVLYEYGAERTYLNEYSVANCKFVAAAPDGTIYASSGKDVFAKKEGESFFRKFLSADKSITGLNVGIGGKILYVLTGQTLSAYSREGTLLGALQSEDGVKSFAVDYRGNVFLLSNGGKLVKYARTLGGYSDPVRYDLAAGYAAFADLALDGEGNLYLIADSNVLIYPKAAFGAFVAEDSDFSDDVPVSDPLFVCEVVKEYTISYIAPDNFEDITSIPRGTRLMCYATVTYAGNQYLRVETEKGTTYLPKADVKVYDEGAAPFRKARCLLPAVGSKVIGVDLYAEPSRLAIMAGAEPLFRALGKEDVFDVISYVAADEDGRDVWGFYRVSYQGKTAYVLTDEVVSVDDDPLPAPPRYAARVKSDALGKTVAVYADASADSEVVARLTDGTEIFTLEPIDKNKEFIQVLYDGEVRYVLSENLGQGGLSSGQVLAIVLSVVAAVGSVLTILILRAGKKHKRFHKE